MDRKLTRGEKFLLKTRPGQFKFIEIFKNDVMEKEGRNAFEEPSLYEMVLLELIAQIEAIKEGLGVKAPHCLTCECVSEQECDAKGCSCFNCYPGGHLAKVKS